MNPKIQKCQQLQKPLKLELPQKLQKLELLPTLHKDQHAVKAVANAAVLPEALRGHVVTDRNPEHLLHDFFSQTFQMRSLTDITILKTLTLGDRVMHVKFQHVHQRLGGSKSHQTISTIAHSAIKDFAWTACALHHFKILSLKLPAVHIAN